MVEIGASWNCLYRNNFPLCIIAMFLLWTRRFHVHWKVCQFLLSNFHFLTFTLTCIAMFFNFHFHMHCEVCPFFHFDFVNFFHWARHFHMHCKVCPSLFSNLTFYPQINIRQSVFKFCKYFGNFRNNYLHQERAGGGQNNSAAVRLGKKHPAYIYDNLMSTLCQLYVNLMSPFWHIGVTIMTIMMTIIMIVMMLTRPTKRCKSGALLPHQSWEHLFAGLVLFHCCHLITIRQWYLASVHQYHPL